MAETGAECFGGCGGCHGFRFNPSWGAYRGFGFGWPNRCGFGGCWAQSETEAETGANADAECFGNGWVRPYYGCGGCGGCGYFGRGCWAESE